MDQFLESWQFNYIVIPLLIIIAKIIDVSLGTMRIILIAKGAKKFAPYIGFLEVLIWIATIGQVIKNLTNPITYIAYALGFAIGNYVGILIENKLALGTVLIRVITRFDASALIDHLRKKDFGVTTVPAEGSAGPVSIIFTVIKRSKIQDIVRIIKELNPNAFYSIEDVRYVSGNYGNVESERKNYWRSFFKMRK